MFGYHVSEVEIPFCKIIQYATIATRNEPLRCDDREYTTAGGCPCDYLLVMQRGPAPLPQNETGSALRRLGNILRRKTSEVHVQLIDARVHLLIHHEEEEHWATRS